MSDIILPSIPAYCAGPIQWIALALLTLYAVAALWALAQLLRRGRGRLARALPSAALFVLVLSCDLILGFAIHNPDPETLDMLTLAAVLEAGCASPP